MPFNFGVGEIFLVLLIVLLLFGAKRIPEIAGSMGKGIKEFKRNMTDVERAIREPERDVRADQRLASPAPDAVPRESETERPEPKRLLN